MAKKVSKEKIERKPGYLYYLGKDGFVWGSPMKSNPKGKKYRAGTEHVVRPKGLCWVGKTGYVETK
jgi:hypothetical protein